MSANKPTAAAMRSARNVWTAGYFPTMTIEGLAELIDAYTGLPQAIEALRFLAEECDYRGVALDALEILEGLRPVQNRKGEV